MPSCERVRKCGLDYGIQIYDLFVQRTLIENPPCATPCLPRFWGAKVARTRFAGKEFIV